MSKDIIFKTFRTYGHPYVYDRHTNSLILLTDDEYKELQKVENMDLLPEKSDVIKKYQTIGLFHPNVVEEIEDRGVVIVEQYLKTRITQLVLQVTQQCNLRCEYCVYSGIYTATRTHSQQRMSFETAKKAIDFFLERNSELAEVTISFYGGEPLLEFDLIAQCVEYAKKQVEGKKILFSMTTNGTILPDYVVDYLVEYDFMINVSLDGSKSEHDASRKFINGEGTFDVIIENIKKIQQRYPEYWSKVRIMTTINPHMNLGCVLEYFETQDILRANSVTFNLMSEINLKQELDYP